MDSEKKKRGRPTKKHRLIKNKDIDNSDTEYIPKLDESNIKNQEINDKPQPSSEFKIKKKIKKDPNIQIQNDLNKALQNQDLNDNIKKIHCTLNKMDIHKVNLVFYLVKAFQDIMNQAQQEETFSLIKNILSTSAKALYDKKTYIRKLKHQLTLSNLSQHDYRRREKDIEVIEKDEIQQVKEEILNKLSASRIVGFKSQDSVLESLKKKHINSTLLQDESDNLEIIVDEEEFKQLKQDQLRLIEKLLNENMFVKFDTTEKPFIKKNQMFQSQTQDKVEAEPRARSPDMRQDSYYEQQDEPRKKTIKISKYEDGEINDKILNDFYGKLFMDKNEFFHLDEEDDVFYMTRNEKDALLNLKSDLMYNDSMFQKEQFEEYSQYIKEIYQKGDFDIQNIEENTFDNILKVVTYVLNNAHYYQKFKLDDGLINPIDVLFILDQFK